MENNKPTYHKMLIRTPLKLYKEIRKIADSKGISVTAYVNLVITNHVDAQNEHKSNLI